MESIIAALVQAISEKTSAKSNAGRVILKGCSIICMFLVNMRNNFGNQENSSKYQFRCKVQQNSINIPDSIAF